MTLHAVSGRIAVEAVSGDLDIVATGDADAHHQDRLRRRRAARRDRALLDATTTSGDLKLAGRLAGPGPFAIETVSGDGLLAPAGDVRVEMTTLSGDLSSNIGGRSEGGRGHRSLAVGTGGPSLTFRSMSGDLRSSARRRVVADPRRATCRPLRRTGRTGRARRTGPARAPAHGRPDEPIPMPAPAAVQNGAIAAAYEEARLRILRSLERGEIDVAEAGRRFEALDAADPVDPRPIDPSSDTTRIPTVEPPDA